MKGRNSLAELVTCKNRHVDAIGGEVSIAFLARRSSHLVDTKLVRYPQALYQLVMATVTTKGRHLRRPETEARALRYSLRPASSPTMVATANIPSSAGREP